MMGKIHEQITNEHFSSLTDENQKKGQNVYDNITVRQTFRPKIGFVDLPDSRLYSCISTRLQEKKLSVDS